MSVPLQNKLACLVGASQGIGAATAIAFARRGSSILILGRNEQRLQQTLDQARDASPASSRDQQTFDFIKVDLSLRSEILRAADEIQRAAGKRKLDYMIQTQGTTPNGQYKLNTEGLESHFTVQCLSRFGLPYLLSQRHCFQTENSRVVTICAPGSHVDEFDVTDLDLSKAKAAGIYGRGLRDLVKAGKRDSIVNDCATAGLNRDFPQTKFFHIFPGFVATSALANGNFPFPIPLAAKTFGTLGSYVGLTSTASQYAETPFRLATSDSPSYPYLSGARLSPVTLTGWAASEDNQKAVYQELQRLLQA